jgi:divalent metal cation (Fe/Co/Zn/Cd) transporter
MASREVWSARGCAVRRAEREGLLRSGLRVSVVAAGWTLLASVAGIWVGAALGSVALIAFGAVGLLDAAGSVTLAVHFRLAGTGHHRADHAERIALRVITAGLVAVGVSTAAVSLVRLVSHAGSRQSIAGVSIAAASLAALTLLAFRKRWVASRLPSRALLADSHLSAVGAVLAAVALAGTAATALFGWWWADPVAAIGIAVVAVQLGVTMAREPPPD